jgi:hypothetical protein
MMSPFLPRALVISTNLARNPEVIAQIQTYPNIRNWDGRL